MAHTEWLSYLNTKTFRTAPTRTYAHVYVSIKTKYRYIYITIHIYAGTYAGLCHVAHQAPLRTRAFFGVRTRGPETETEAGAAPAGSRPPGFRRRGGSAAAVAASGPKGGTSGAGDGSGALGWNQMEETNVLRHRLVCPLE